jgi:hypothetical protein
VESSGIEAIGSADITVVSVLFGTCRTRSVSQSSSSLNQGSVDASLVDLYFV